MRHLLLILSLVATACAGSPPRETTPPKKFAMKTYTFVLLKRGPAWSPEETPESKKLFEGHMANIKAMARARKLIIAGPFDAPKDDKAAYAGLFVFDVPAEEAKQLLAGDPAIVAGRLVPEMMPWYGPAGLTYDGAEEALREPPH
ncbi:MAG TPA: hypothetical protein VMZ53_15755 [Kofleriaceae bacterium]|nr:hypothetical protein [Kofleriaceae bacterium]